MLIVPTQAVPNQSLQVQLGNQACTLNVYQYPYGLFMDVYVSGAIIIGGVICENLNRIVRDFYLGFVGDFVWFDTQGSNDPIYTGLGSRYQLIYLEAADINQEVASAIAAGTLPLGEQVTFLIAG
jgi:hypothetical protein